MATRRLAGMTKMIGGERKLKRLYKKTLILLEKLPEESMYRQHTGAIVCYRLQKLNEACGDEKKMEEELCGGRIEMLVAQAEAEYELVHKMLAYKPWESLVQEPLPGQWKWPPA